MRSPTPPRLTRLDPRYPLLWRDERTVQFGLEGALQVDADEPWVEVLLSRLRVGIRPGSFDLVAHGAGAPRAAARALLEQLGPMLVDDPPPTPPIRVEGVQLSDGRTRERMRQALSENGLRSAAAHASDAVTVVLVEGAAAAVQLAPFLREDAAHLPVAFEQEAFTVGPLVVPGRTPCLTCRDAEETRRDPAWPLLHAQLVARSAVVDQVRISRAADLVGRLLRAPQTSAGLLARVSPDGRLSWRTVPHHEECPCLCLSSQSLRRTETGSDLRDLHCETTRSPAYARRA